MNFKYLNGFNRIRKHPDFKKLFSNTLNYTLFQATNYLVPLITIPYVVRVIGPEKFGILSFALAVIIYLQLFVDYGFNLSAVQKVATSRNNPEVISKTFNAILFIRISIMILVFTALYISSFYLSEINRFSTVYFYTFLMIPGITLQSLWFYNGMEKMEYLNYVNFLTRIIYLVGIFGFIHSEADYVYIPLINSLALIFSGLFSIVLIRIKFNIRFYFPGINSIKENLASGWPVFISNLGINLYRNSSVFILGLFASKEIVGFYSAAERIVKIIQNVFSPITNSLYPYISRIGTDNKRRSHGIILKVLFITAILTITLSSLLFVFSDFISLHFLGKSFNRSAGILRIICFVLPFGVSNYIIGIIFMLNNSLEKEFMKSVLFTGLASILISYSFTAFWLSTGTAWAFLLSEIILFTALTKYIFNNRNKWVEEIV